MSKLDELIIELCPDGVEYKKLSSVISVERGKRVVRDQLPVDGKYSVYQNSLTPLGLFNDSNYSSYTTFIIGAGAAGEIGFSYDDFWAADDCYPLVCSDIYDARFLYHLMLSKKDYISSQVRKGTIPRLSRSIIENMRIPVPPLLVQREIVCILDHFTELTSELTSELAARKKQYEYYLERLLSETNVEKKTLSECCESIADGDHQPPPKSDSGIPFITISNIENNRIDFSNTKYVPNSYFEGLHEKRKAKFDDILYSVVGSFGIPVHIDFDKPFVFQRHIAILRPNQAIVKSKYLYYCMKSPSFFSQADAVATGAAQRTVGLAMLGRLTVPIVSITEQERIVSILDRFNAISNDLSSGLPAEIAARQKQYEYYRDKLLTFKELQKS